jgi:PAS domain S-box-containing protein
MSPVVRSITHEFGRQAMASADKRSAAGPAANLGTRVRLSEGPPMVRRARATPKAADIGAVAIDVAGELLGLASVSIDDARRALDRIRRAADAIHAAIWIVDDVGAACGARVDRDDHLAMLPVTMELAGRPTVDRLRRHGALVCRAGELSGAEALVPSGVGSFAVATDHALAGAIGALVIGWAGTTPRIDQAALAHLRITAAVLHRGIAQRQLDSRFPAEAVLESLKQRIVVLDKHGTILAVNPAWAGFAARHREGAAMGRGANYFEICRRAVANGAPDATAVIGGIQAVARGESSGFQTAYPCGVVADAEWCVLTAKPFEHPEGGVVLTHTDVTPQQATALAGRMGENVFHRLADALPAALWITSPDGRVIHGNERWMAMARAAASDEAPIGWTDVVHPDDRAAAVAGFEQAVTNGATFDIELRMKAADGTYRWSACVGGPRVGIDGRLESYVGFCCDVSAKRRAEWALSELAGKLVLAQEAERSRIGRELHDDLGQQVVLLCAKLEALARDRRMPRERVNARVLEAEQGLQELAVTIHNLSHELHPAKLRLLGLVTTLEALCRDVSKQGGVEVRFLSQNVPADVTEDLALCVFRVAQEALQNAVKHSGARHITMSLTATGADLQLRVSDDGRGFGPVASEHGGIGLLTMRERVELSGGRLRIETPPTGGTTLEATVTLPNGSGGSGISPPATISRNARHHPL